jgi:hypothetical protein
MIPPLHGTRECVNVVTLTKSYVTVNLSWLPNFAL